MGETGFRNQGLTRNSLEPWGLAPQRQRSMGCSQGLHRSLNRILPLAISVPPQHFLSCGYCLKHLIHKQSILEEQSPGGKAVDTSTDKFHVQRMGILPRCLVVSSVSQFGKLYLRGHVMSKRRREIILPMNLLDFYLRLTVIKFQR